jgi:DNA topoisomerase I
MAKKSGGGKNLMIVESPAKAKTIEKFLDNEFIVKSSYGHIRDLPKNDKAIDIKNHYKPTYIVTEDKQHIVKELKKATKEAKEVWLATDEDREGEAISWHLCEALGLDVKKAKRIVFHEITKKAINEAVKNPRHVDMNLVDAQQARRILDRLVGFELSPILWRKISLGSSLSAGRVQSVSVRLIVEREREIQSFQPEAFFKIVGWFNPKKKSTASFKAELPKNKNSFDEANSFLQSCSQSEFVVKDVAVKPGKRTPSAPFITSTLQQEAARKLGFSVSRTMIVAQKLYEGGKITYMRTDSVNLSNEASGDITNEIKSSYGEKYHQFRKYTSKSANAQEAHEAIRPTYISNREISGPADEIKLYNLIWKRTIASQMSDAELERTTIKIGISKLPNEELVASGEVLLFDGFLKVYMESTDDENEDTQEGLLPALKAGDHLELKEMFATERFSRAQPRYTEAALVKKLEELGIGRPSTYAPTISTIQKRGYVEKKDKDGVVREYHVLHLNADKKIIAKKETEITGAEKYKLFPTDVGAVVNDFLKEHFPTVMDYSFTAEIEKEFDDISNGNQKWQEMLNDFYKPFHKDVEHTMENAERASGERFLGDDPKSGKPVSVRIGRYGPMVQIGKSDDEEKPRYGKLRPGMNLETITLEEALTVFNLPREVGEFEGLMIAANEGRFGPYIVHDKKFFSLKKEQDVMRINLQDAIELIEAKRKSVLKEFPDTDVRVLEGRWGPYVKSGKLNARIPKDKKPESLTLEECLELIEKSKTAPKGRARRGAKQQ